MYGWLPRPCVPYLQLDVKFDEWSSVATHDAELLLVGLDSVEEGPFSVFGAQ